MQCEQIEKLLSMLKANGIETSEVANGGTDAGEWIILANHPSCTANKLSELKAEISETLGIDELKIEARGDGMVLRGIECLMKDGKPPMTYSDFFAKLGKCVVSKRSFAVSYLSHYCAPFTGSGKVLIPAGIEFIPEQKMRFDAMYCHVSDEDVIELAMQHEKETLNPQLLDRLTGVSFYLTKYDFDVGNVE